MRLAKNVKSHWLSIMRGKGTRELNVENLTGAQLLLLSRTCCCKSAVSASGETSIVRECEAAVRASDTSTLNISDALQVSLAEWKRCVSTDFSSICLFYLPFLFIVTGYPGGELKRAVASGRSTAGTLSSLLL